MGNPRLSVSNESSAQATGAGSVERLAVEPIQSRPRRMLRAVEDAKAAVEEAQAVAATMPVIIERPPSLNDHIQAAFSAIARILAVKLQLLLTLLGAFVLALGAMAWQSQMGLAVLIAWCCLAVLPMVWLDYAGRQRRP